MNALEKAIVAAANELIKEYGWSLGETDEYDEYGSDDQDPLKSAFGNVMLKHLTPIFNSETFKQARIAALRAELAELEK